MIVEIDRNALHRIAGSVALENSAHDGRLSRIHFEPHASDNRPAVAVAFRAALDRDAAISEHAAAGVQSIERELLDAAESALREILQIKRIDNSMHADEKLGLLVACVDSLGDEDHPDPEKLELLENAK